MIYQMNSVCDILAKAKSFPRETRFHYLIGINWCIVPYFVVPFKFILNTERFKQMEYGGSTVDDNSTLERVKNITFMANSSFHSLNVSNNWNITRSHKKLLESFLKL